MLLQKIPQPLEPQRSVPRWPALLAEFATESWGNCLANNIQPMQTGNGYLKQRRRELHQEEHGGELPKSKLTVHIIIMAPHTGRLQIMRSGFTISLITLLKCSQELFWGHGLHLLYISFLVYLLLHHLLACMKILSVLHSTNSLEGRINVLWRFCNNHSFHCLEMA